MPALTFVRWILRYAPIGAVGTIGYALGLLAAFTAAVGHFASTAHLTVADCSGPALNDVLQLVAVGQAFSAAVVVIIGIGIEWKNSELRTVRDNDENIAPIEDIDEDS